MLRKPIISIAFVLAMVATVLMAPGAPAQVPGTDVLYTDTADFGLGTTLNLDLDTDGQMMINLTPEPFPFVNVAASARGTMVRINANDGTIIGEYRTAPQGFGLNPSRTTVDLFGNVWTGNRNESGFVASDQGPGNHGSVVKIGLIIGGERVDEDGNPLATGDYLAPPYNWNTCIDRDGDGYIKTSRGLGDIRPWVNVTDGTGGPTALVEDADDECILVYQRLLHAEAVRHVSVDANNDVWVGGYPFTPRHFYLLDGDDGSILGGFNAATMGPRPPFWSGCGGYGGLVDGDGILWSASISQNALLRYDPSTGNGSCILVHSSYGLGIDTTGHIWNSRYNFDSVRKVTPAGGLLGWFPTGGASGDRGVAVTPADDHVWVANSWGSDVSRLDNSGAVLKVIPVGTTPTGVAVDHNGMVWVTNLGSDDVMRIDPAAGGDGLGAVNLTVGLGAGAGPYNYSDMTGLVALGSTSVQGNWSIVQDGGAAGLEWGVITWNTEDEGSEPEGTEIVVEARAADTEAGLSSQAWVEVESSVPFSMFGRYIEVRVTLKANSPTPVLSDIRISIANEPPDCSAATASVDRLWPPNHKWHDIAVLGVTDPDGDPITLGVASIFQDEPVNGPGDGDTAPDGTGVGTDTARVRAERAGGEDGRVYHIGFTADDGAGGTCSGTVMVGVPHNKKATPVDGGPLYDSTIG